MYEQWLRRCCSSGDPGANTGGREGDDGDSAAAVAKAEAMYAPPETAETYLQLGSTSFSRRTCRAPRQ
jgi:hypothetical protein